MVEFATYCNYDAVVISAEGISILATVAPSMNALLRCVPPSMLAYLCM